MCVLQLICVLFIQKNEEVDFFREKFAGTQADRKLKEEADAKAVAEQLKKTNIEGGNFFIETDFFFLLFDFAISISMKHIFMLPLFGDASSTNIALEIVKYT